MTTPPFAPRVNSRLTQGNEVLTDGGLDPETARKSTAPGDVVVANGYPVRVVSVVDAGLTGIVYGAESHGTELQPFDWVEVEEYHHRDDVDLGQLRGRLCMVPDEDDVDGADQDDVAEAVEEVDDE